MAAPAFHHGPRPFVADRHARSWAQPALHQSCAHGAGRFHCRHRRQRSLRRIQPSSSSNARLVSRQPEVGRPAPQQRVQRLDRGAKAAAARPAQQCSSPSPSVAASSPRQCAASASGATSAVAQELALPRPRHRALLAFTVSLSRSPGNRSDSITRSPAARCAHRCCSRRHSGRTRGLVVPVPGPDRVSRMFDSSGDSGPPCGVPSVAAAPARPASCPLPGSGGSASALVLADLPRQPAHQDVVVDPVEELLQIHVHHPALALRHILCALGAAPDAHCVPAESRSSSPRRSGRRSGPALDASPAGSADPPPSGCPACVPRLAAWGCPPGAPAAVDNAPPAVWLRIVGQCRFR